MATIERRDNKTGPSWKLTWYQSGKRQKPLTFTNELEAKQWKAALELHKGDAHKVASAFEKARSQSPALSEAAEHHISRLRVTPLTRQTYGSYLRNHITPALGAAPVDTITSDDVRHLIATMENKRLSQKMITNVLGCFTAIMDHAVEQGWSQKNPYNHAMLPAAGVRVERDMFLTVAEAKQIIRHLPAHHQEPCKALLITGLRPSEMRALTVEDIHLEARQPVVRVTKAMKDDRENGEYVGVPKSRTSIRSVPIHPSALGMFESAVEGRGPTEPLYKGSTGNRLNGSSLRRSWREAVKAARAEEVRPLTKQPNLYSLRHSYASLMIDEGLSIFKVSARMGHGSVQVTQDVYAHLMPDSYAEDAHYAERAFSGLVDPVIAELEPA